MAATAKTPSTLPTMTLVLRDDGAALCVAEELLDAEGPRVEVDDEFVLVEGESTRSTLCDNKIVQLIMN